MKTTAKLLRPESQCSSFPIINRDRVGLLMKVLKHDQNVTNISVHTVKKIRYNYYFHIIY